MWEKKKKTKVQHFYPLRVVLSKTWSPFVFQKAKNKILSILWNNVVLTFCKIYKASKRAQLLCFPLWITVMFRELLVKWKQCRKFCLRSLFIMATTAASRLVQKLIGYLLRPMAFFAPFEERRLGDTHCRVPGKHRIIAHFQPRVPNILMV